MSGLPIQIEELIRQILADTGTDIPATLALISKIAGAKGTDAIYDLVADIASALNHHEHVWPVSDGEGTAGGEISVTTDDEDDSHAPATTQDYWGQTYEIITPSDIATAYSWIGFYIYGNTTGKDMQWQIFRVVFSTLQLKNGGNGWDEGETVLTVADGSDYAIGDQAWVRNSTTIPDGEIVNVTNVVGDVITIARETSQFGAPNTGLRFDYEAGPGDIQIYRINRDAEGLRDSTGSFAVASAKDLMRYEFHSHRMVLANDGLIMRALNESDGISSTMGVKAIYED